MAITFDWASPGSYSAGNLITGNGTTGDLKNLANDGRALGAAVNNEGGTILAGIEFRVKCASAPSGSPYVQIWFLTSLDSTNYEDGDTSTTPGRMPDLVIPVRLVSTQQRIVIGPVLIPNGKIKTLLINKTGQAFTNVNDENQLSYVTWKDEGV